eukprot:725364_1
MAFYDANAEQRTLTPLQKALLLPPDAILRHQDLLTSIAKSANFSDEKAEYILDILLKNISESLTYNNPETSMTSLIILDYTVRNGNIFAQYVFGRYILQKLYTICCRDLTKVTDNHKAHQDFQYKLIGIILKWHQMFTNVNGSTLNYTFSRLQKSGILALYQSYKQTQKLFNNNASPANSQQDLMPNLPPSPQPNKKNIIDEKAKEQPPPPDEPPPDINVESLIYKDGRVKLEYSEKFQTEVNELIGRYLKPTREVLSSQKINLADKKLQKYLEILQIIQQRLVKVISEVKNEENVVSLAIKANDCIVSTILWFNSLVKKSKQSKNKNKSITHEKHSSVSKNVMENIDLVGLEQQLLLDNANLFKRKQLRDLKIQKEKQEKEQKEQQNKMDNMDNNNNNNDANMEQQVQQAVDLISGDIKDEKVGTEIVSVEQVVANIVGNNDNNENNDDGNDNVNNSEPVSVNVSEQQQQQQQQKVIDENTSFSS